MVLVHGLGGRGDVMLLYRFSAKKKLIDRFFFVDTTYIYL
jgi:hypothetical protein